jgi:hypothetical protein
MLMHGCGSKSTHLAIIIYYHLSDVKTCCVCVVRGVAPAFVGHPRLYFGRQSIGYIQTIKANHQGSIRFLYG